MQWRNTWPRGFDLKDGTNQTNHTENELMDPRLAEIYGTNEEATDVEKTAAAELAEKLASDGSMDIDGMADEDIEALAQEVLSADENQEEGNEETEEDAETTDKVAEADHLGRVMAHAYVHELKGIDKEAAKGKAVKAGVGRVAAMLASAKKTGKKLVRKGKAKAMELGGKAKGHALAAKAKADKTVRKHPYKAMGAAALAAGGAGVAAGRKSKEASALDTLATERAYEILAENGYEFEESEETEEKQAGSSYDVLAAAVEARAAELLEAEGFEFTDEE